MPTISSASPEALRRYGRAAHAGAAQLAAEARHLDAALATLQARCREYPVVAAAGLAGRLLAASRGAGELGAWVEGVAAAFIAADTGAAAGPALGELTPAPAGPAARALGAELRWALAATGRWGAEQSDWLAELAFERAWASIPGHAAIAAALGLGETVAWNLIAAALLGPLSTLEVAARSEALLDTLAPALLVAFGPGLALCGVGVLGLSIAGDLPRWAGGALHDPGSASALTEHGIWGSGFDSVNPHLRRALAARFDALNLDLARLAGAAPGKAAAPRLPPPASSAYGAFAAISYRAGEQVVLERLNGAGDYRISITGLDPTKPGAPNNFEAVMLTDAFTPQENHYYQHVRERFFEALRQLPPGSRLHMQGHSMGGGMCLLLRQDPEVQRRLRAAGISVPTLTIYGAVVPAAAEFAPIMPAGSPFMDTELRAYVDRNDALAQNVGAGYAGYPAVQMIGPATTVAPHTAHGDYADPANYAGLPPELLELPYLIDADYYQRTVPIAPPPPPPPLDEPPIIIAFA